MTLDQVVTPDGTRHPPAPTSGPAVTLLFAATSLVGAGLLFVVQPLIARLLLPDFGGSATVWSTSSLFFQLLLLCGYAYVHLSTRRLGRTSQPLLHLAVLALPLLALPVVVPADASPEPGTSAALWLLRTLALTIGLPFAVISTTGPLLQRWYSWSGSRRSDDPYFLFATSNLGSFGGLLAYPFLVEPFLTLDQQRAAWSWGFALFLGLMAGCGAVAWRGGRRQGPVPGPVDPAEPEPALDLAGPGPGRVLTWLWLAFLPSALMLAVTAHISTDVAAIPLMWVVPLAIYLATFVVAFARTSRRVPPAWPRAATALALLAGVASLLHGGLPVAALVLVDLALLATAAYAAHARLATLRPDPAHLTTFFIVVATGGALGGLLNGLVAPLLFPSVWEYPLSLVGVALLSVGTVAGGHGFAARRYHPAFAAAVEGSLLFLAMLVLAFGASRLLALAEPGAALAVTACVLLAGLGFLVGRRPAPAVVALVAWGLLPLALGDDVLERDRTFYGSYTVRDDGASRTFVHGTTVHGTQWTDERAGEPTTYYARSGPVGDAFAATDPDDVAVVGLGVGTVAAYGEPGMRMTYLEIDPAVVRVARDPGLFTYLSDSAADLDYVVGDGRLRLAQQPRGSFDLLLLDAFTSDAIPVHLLTREAFDTYRDAVGDDGLVMVHISNRVFDLEPVVAAAADHLGWEVSVGFGEPDETGGVPAKWMALSPDPDVLARLGDRDGWRSPGSSRVAWTDDFSSVLSVLR